jgi:hypothetical protein
MGELRAEHKVDGRTFDTIEMVVLTQTNRVLQRN